VKWVDEWHRFLREVVEPTYLEILRTCLDMDMSMDNLLKLALLEQWGWPRQSPELPSNLKHSVVL